MKTFLLLGLLISMNALAHSGGTNSSGCHNETRTGGYHCHRSETEKDFIVRGPASDEKNKEKSKKKQNQNNQQQNTPE